MEIIKGSLLYKILDSKWGTFKNIFNNRIRPVVHESIEKIKLCHDKELGFATLECPKCKNNEKIPFSCKNRFCSSCGKVACDQWMDKVTSWALPDINYQHIVFTIPEELRDFLIINRKSLNILFIASSKALKYVYEEKYNCMPGIISVIHTFGKDIKWNPHIHTIVTIGGLSIDQKSWNYNNFIPFGLLNKSWKYYTITLLREWAKNNLSQKKFNNFNQLLNQLYKKKWYINIGEKLKSLAFTVNYIGRYAKRPVIAETRIKNFDGDNVSFSFKDRATQKDIIITLPVLDFIGKIIKHIPDKNFRIIRYSGIFANRVKAKTLLIVQNLLSKSKQALVYFNKKAISWRDRIKKTTGIDPYQCKKCKTLMNIVSITIKIKDGFLKTIYFYP